MNKIFYIVIMTIALGSSNAFAQDIKNASVYIYRPCFLFGSALVLSVSGGDDDNIQDIECGSYVKFESPPGFKTFYALGEKNLSTFVTLDLKPGGTYFVKSDYGWSYLDIELMKKASFKTMAHLRNVTQNAYTPAYINIIRQYCDNAVFMGKVLDFFEYDFIQALIENSKSDEIIRNNRLYNSMPKYAPGSS